MNKSLILKWGLTTLLSAGLAASAFAIDVRVNGQLVNFTGVEPLQIQGRVFVPLRGVLEQMGADIVWDQPTKTVIGSRGDRRFELPIGSRTAVVNGRITTLDVPAQVIRGTTMVPLRFVSEALGADIAWSGRTQTVEIVTDERYASTPDEERFGGTDTNRPANNTNTGRLDRGTTSPTTPTGAAPEIRSFRHTAQGPVKAGDTIEVQMEGTPGGRAFFDIVGVASNVAMRETQPGRYTGRVTVPPGVNIRDARAIAQLNVGNQASPVVQAGNPITVDAQPPQILNFSPEQGTVVTRARPDIYAEYRSQGETGVDPNSVQLRVNGQDVTSRARITPGFIIYTPEQPLNGSTMVQLRVTDRAGNVSNAVTTFNVRPTAEGLTTVTHNAENPLKPGEAFTVTARGEAGGTAVFTIPGVVQNQPMRETSAGTYVGTYTVKTGDKAYNAPVQVRLTSNNGRASQLDATRPVSLTGGTLQKPFLIEPKPGTKLGNSITVVGRAEPGSTVRITLNTTGRLFGVLPLEGSEIVQEVRTGSDGIFRSEALPLPKPLGARNVQYEVSLVTIDPSGRTSEPLTVKYGAQ